MHSQVNDSIGNLDTCTSARGRGLASGAARFTFSNLASAFKACNQRLNRDSNERILNLRRLVPIN